MDSDEDVHMSDAEPIPSSTKSKAYVPVEDESLPWYCQYEASRWVDPCLLIHRVEKYRPVTLNDVVSHKDITSTSMRLFVWSRSMILTLLKVEKFIEKNRLPHLLFYGPPGTGKTSTILAVARRIYGPSYRKQILEVSPFHICRCDFV